MKADLSKRFSQATSKAVMEELLRFDVPPKPKSRAAKSLAHVSEQLIANPYPDKTIQFYIDVTGDCFYVYDATRGLIHSFTREVTHKIEDDGGISQLYRNAKEMVQARVKEIEESFYEQEKEVPDLILDDGSLKFDCTDGAFFDAEEMPCEQDFINCVLTPNEVVVNADAVRWWGNNNVRNGGRALMMLNTMGRSQHKIKEGRVK